MQQYYTVELYKIYHEPPNKNSIIHNFICCIFSIIQCVYNHYCSPCTMDKLFNVGGY